jgi:hypothetical protein
MNAQALPEQAPIGGAFSEVNKLFYEGGQFMPSDLAMPRGWAGKVQAAKAWRWEGSPNLQRLQVEPLGEGYSVRGWLVGQKSGRVLFKCASADQAAHFARSLIAARAAEYEAQGFQPHPTQLLGA